MLRIVFRQSVWFHFAKIAARGRKGQTTENATRKLALEHLEDRRLLTQATGLTAAADALDQSDSPDPFFVEYATVSSRIPLTNAKGVPIGGTAWKGGHAVAVLDANLDGLPDFVVVHGQAYYSVVLNSRDHNDEHVFTSKAVYIGKKKDLKNNAPASLGLHDFDNDGLMDLYFNNTGKGTLAARNPRNLKTIHRPRNIISSSEFRDAGFQTQFNQGDGSFVYRNTGIRGGGDPRSTVFSDFDGDGNFDAFVGTAAYFGIWWSGSSAASQLYAGKDDGTFGPNIISSMVVNDPGDLFQDEYGRGNKDLKGIVVRDFDNDGKPDIIATAYSDVWDHVWKVPFDTAKPQGALVDLDRDGIPDGGYQGDWERGILVLRNISTPGNIQFEDVSQSAIDNALGLTDEMHVQSAIPADIDHDGDLDLLVSGPRHFMAHNSVENNTNIMRVYRNDSSQGQIVFTNMTEESGLNVMNHNDTLPAPYQGGLVVPGVMKGGQDMIATPALSAGAAIDVDNDGDLDWAAVNRAWVSSLTNLPRTEFASWLFLNDGSGHFTLVPRELRGLDSPARDLSYGDLNGDGRIDLVMVDGTNQTSRPPDREMTLVYFNNVENDNHYLFVSVTERDNVLGIGTKVTVYEAGTDQIVGYDEVRTDFSYRSKKDTILHFGLRDVGSVDVKLETRNGRIKMWYGLPVNQTVTLDLDENEDFAGDTVGLHDPQRLDWTLHNRFNSIRVDVAEFRAGRVGAIPLAGDWDGDGRDTVGWYDPATQKWFLNNATDGTFDGVTYATRQPGAGPSWLPIAGDWNNDGIDTVGLYRPGANNWYLSDGIGVWESVTTIVRPARVITKSWLPIAGNWDGEGGDSIGIYDASRGRWILNNDIDGRTDDINLIRGRRPHPTWKPVAGDWNNNGEDTVGLYNPATGRWYLNNKTDGTANDSIRFRTLGALAASRPVAGAWDGRGVAVASSSRGKRSVLAAYAPTNETMTRLVSAFNGYPYYFESVGAAVTTEPPQRSNEVPDLRERTRRNDSRSAPVNSAATRDYAFSSFERWGNITDWLGARSGLKKVLTP